MAVAVAGSGRMAYGYHFDCYANCIDRIAETTPHLWHIYRYRSVKCAIQHPDFVRVHAIVDALPTVMLAIVWDRNHALLFGKMNILALAVHLDASLSPIAEIRRATANRER